MAQEILMTSWNDVMIVCSNPPVGKPLCMHIGTADVCLHIHWHSCQNPQTLQMHLNLFICSLTQYLCPWHPPPHILVCPHTGVLIYLHNNKTQTSIINKDDECNVSTNKYNKIRWVNAQWIDNLKVFYTLSKAEGSKANVLHKQLPRCIIPLHLGMYEHHAAGPSGHLPAHPRVTTQPPAVMNCDDLGGTYLIRVTQHEVRYTITTSTYLGYYQMVIILEIVKLHMKNKQCPLGDKTRGWVNTIN